LKFCGVVAAAMGLEASAAGQIAQALEKKKRIVVIDWRYRILVALWRLIPPFLWKRLPVRN
jgi:hypothetical protein